MKLSRFPAHEHDFYLTRGSYFEVQKPFQKDSLMVTAIKTKSCLKLGVNYNDFEKLLKLPKMVLLKKCWPQIQLLLSKMDSKFANSKFAAIF